MSQKKAYKEEQGEHYILVKGIKPQKYKNHDIYIYTLSNIASNICACIPTHIQAHIKKQLQKRREK
jgi:hypothetical protein